MRSLRDLTQHLTTRADDNHAPPVSVCPKTHTISNAFTGCQDLVRFFALLRIKPHAPLLVRVPVNSFEFHTCVRTPQAEHYYVLDSKTIPNLIIITVDVENDWKSPTPSLINGSVRLFPLAKQRLWHNCDISSLFILMSITAFEYFLFNEKCLIQIQLAFYLKTGQEVINDFI